MTAPPKNRRLDPDVRKTLILDQTAKLISEEGVYAVKMDRVAREANISKPLIYAYFKNKTTLLQELLVREQKVLADMQAISIGLAADFEDLIRRTTATYLEFAESHGATVQRLLNEPAIAEALGELDRKERQRGLDFMAKEIRANYNIPKKIAQQAADISMSMTGAAGDMIARGEADRQSIEHITITLALGGLHALTAEFGKKPKKK